MQERNAHSPMRLRTVFISDIHLGFKGCSAEWLLDFLHIVETDTLILVGDIIDVWSMQKNMFWPQSHNNVLRTILGKAKRGTKVIFVPGNHDEVFREFDGAVFGNLEVHRECVHTTAAGRRMLDGGGTRVLRSSGRWRGPGHNSVLTTPQGQWLVYHTYDLFNLGTVSAGYWSGRRLQLRPMRWTADSWPIVDAPLPMNAISAGLPP